MARYQDIADYYEIDRINGNSSTKSLAALVLYRFVKGLLRHMGWPETEYPVFGKFNGGGDSASVAVTFTVAGRLFSMLFDVQYNGPKVESPITCPPEALAWQLTIDRSSPLRYVPRVQDALPVLYEQASELVLLKSANAPPAPPPPAPPPLAPQEP